MANNTISQIEINNETYDLMDVNILNKIYPIGSIYMSVNSTSPASFIGGTWERIQNRFLLAAGSNYNAGATGGEATHTLTPAETATKNHTHTLSSHTHTVTIGKHSHTVTTTAKQATNIIKLNDGTLKWQADKIHVGTGSATDALGGSGRDIYVSIPALSGTAAEKDLGTKTSAAPSTDKTGGLTAANGSAHNNMPPYLAVYIWKRTA